MERKNKDSLNRVGKDDYAALDRIGSALQAKYPDFSVEEITEITKHLISNIADKISSGEDLAFIKSNPDGSMKLTIFEMKVTRKRQ